MSELKIPMRYIDFGRLLSTLGSVSLPLIPKIETWLADNGIACRVTNPWKFFLTSWRDVAIRRLLALQR